jgi:hypothetical protein
MHNKAEVDAYLERLRQYVAERIREYESQEPPEVVKRIRALKEARTAQNTPDDIARSLGLTEAELMAQALRRFLYEKRREILQERLEIFARYQVETLEQLEQLIATGQIVEHPSWEDLITVENLEATLREIDEHLQNL